MKPACQDFRRELEQLLATSSDAAMTARRELGWHEHLLGCADCRQLLQAEDALEALIESLPTPALPPFLVERVLLRLRTDTDQEAGLDQLLELDAGSDVPAGLPERVLSGLDARRDEVLDRLLAGAGEVVVPVGLSDRVLASIEERREAGLEQLLEFDHSVAEPVGLGARIHSRLEAEVASEGARRRRARWLGRTTTLVRGGLAAALLAALSLWVSDRLDQGSSSPLDPATAAELARMEIDLPEEGLLESWPALELMGLLEESSATAGDDGSGILVGAGVDDAGIVLGELDEGFWAEAAREEDR